MKKYLVLLLLLLMAAASQAQNTKQEPKAGSLTLTIHYRYAADNTMAARSYIADGLSEGDPFLVVSPYVAGHYPDRDTVYGVMPGRSVVDSVMYYRGNTPEVYTVSVDQTDHGQIAISPEGDIEAGTQVTITVTPDEFYELGTLKAYNKNDESQEVKVTNQSFIMPRFDVMVKATFVRQLPTINGRIDPPKAICAGESLELTAPEVSNADKQGWQMASNDNFGNYEIYEGQTLDAGYNGWKLRYFATNSTGTVYSNVVGIKVNSINPKLSGDTYLCTMQVGTYTADNVGNASLTWTVTDEAATLTETGKKLTVTWATQGQHTVTLLANNNETGCSATVEMEVTVQSFVSDVNDLVVKKHNGRDYILIYPNPKDTYKYQWYKDGAPISGANGQYYYQKNGLSAGVYKLYLSLNADANGNLFGGAFTNEYTVAAPSTLVLSPNPVQASEGVRLINEDGGEVTVSIYSLDGRLLQRQTVSGPQPVLNVNLPRGIYMVNIAGNENNVTRKLIIE